MFKVLKSGKRGKKSWKRMITKVTFVGPGFTRKPPKYERFIRPTGQLHPSRLVYRPQQLALFHQQAAAVVLVVYC
jgi:ribosome biogenesis protein NSA2